MCVGQECFSNWGYKITKKDMLILMVFNWNIVDLTTAITSWNKQYFI
jgi:hypothetical protein